MASRIHQLDRLDRLNQHLGSYDARAKMLGPLLSKGGRKPVRVHDLASGHGGSSATSSGACPISAERRTASPISWPR
jgi:hypothetical protein